jgi:endonuclease/exonuclease/phosphatase family metal-dependent hydrolase
MALVWLAAGCTGSQPELPVPSEASTPPEIPPSWPGSFPRVVIDGRLDDWSAEVTQLTDPADAPDGPVDIRRVLVTDDATAVYLQLDLGTVVNVQGLKGSLTLLLDADDDPGTGVALHGLSGVDVAIDFTRQDAEQPSQVLEGIAVRAVPSSIMLSPYDLGLWFEPRHSSRVIELRLARGSRLPDGRGLFTAASFHGKLVGRDLTGTVRDETRSFTHEFRESLAGGEPVTSAARPDPLARAPEADLRVVVWNVSRNRMLERPEPFSRILAALSPDVVLLDEVPPGATEDHIRNLLAHLADFTKWSITPGENGGSQRGAVASRFATTAVPGLSRIVYPDSTLRVMGGTSSPGLMDVARNARSGAIPAHGTEVNQGDRRILVVTLDLVCCGNSATAAQDRVRRIEAAAIRAAVHATLNREAFDAVLIGGDFNLVGSQFPLDELSRDLDLDGGDLSVVEALQLDGLSSATWDEGSGPFPPGQLDYLLYSDRSLEVRRAFVFDSEDLAPDWLAAHGLQAEDSDLASDHRPVVADFMWSSQAGEAQPPDN